MSETVDLKSAAQNKAKSFSLDISRKTLASRREFFLQEDSVRIREQLFNDLTKYIEPNDVGLLNFIALDFFVPAFLDRVCNVYDNPPVFKLQKDGEKLNVDDSLITLLEEVKINLVLQDNFVRARYHGTSIPYIRYNEKTDKIWIDLSLNESNTFVLCYEGQPKDPYLVAYKVGKGNETFWYVWDKENKEHYRTDKDPEPKKSGYGLENTKLPIDGNEDTSAPDYFPFVPYHYKLHSPGFWGQGMDSLVDLERIVNVLLTITGDDSIMETIRILLLNFVPEGETSENGSIKTGMRHPFYDKSGFASQKGNIDGKVLSGELYNEDILKFITSISDIISNMHGIDNVIKETISGTLSGIAIKLKREPLMQRYSKDVNLLRYYDRDLIEAIVAVNNYHRKTKISIEGLKDLVIDYQEPTVVGDEKTDYELERMRWEDGTSSIVDYMVKRNPELTREDAQKKIADNLQEYNDMFAAARAVLNPAKDNININQEQE